jgi:hypothetical protein
MRYCSFREPLTHEIAIQGRFVSLVVNAKMVSLTYRLLNVRPLNRLDSS